MKKYLILIFCFCSLIYGKAQILKTDNIILKNGSISLSIDRKRGCIKSISYKGFSLKSKTGFFSTYIWPLPPDKYGGDNRGRPLISSRKKAIVGEIKNSENGITLPLKWNTESGEIDETIFIPDEGKYFRISLKIKLKKEVSEIGLRAEKIEGFNLENLVFYPEEEKIGWRKYTLSPCYTVAYEKDKNLGLGILSAGKGDINKISKQVIYKKSTPEFLNLSAWVKKIEKGQKTYSGSFYVFVLSDRKEILEIWKKADPESFAKRKEVEIIKVFPDKLIYDNNENGSIGVSICNNSSSPQKVRVDCYFVKDIDEKERIGKKYCVINPLETKKISFNFNSGEEDYGREVQIKLFSGGKLADEKKEYFTVGTNWVKYYDYCIVYPSRMPYGKNGIPWEIYNLRENYITTTHIFAWYPILGDLDPKVDDMYMSEQGIMKSKKGLLRFTKACEKFGIKKEAYYAIWVNSIPGSLDFAADPTKILYNKYGQPFLDTFKISEDKTVTVPTINLYTKYFRDYLSREIVESIDMFGWDSVFYDCLRNLGMAKPKWNSVYHHYTYDGKLAGKILGDTPEEAVKKWMNEITGKVRKKYPNFVINANFIGPVARQLTEDKREEKLYLTYFSLCDAIMAELSGGGAQLAQKAGVGIFKNLKEHFDYTGRWICSNGEKRRKVFPYGPFNYAGEVGTKGYLAISFANNFHVGGWWPAPAYSYFGKPLMEYYKFRIRYSAYLYDDNLKWIPPEKVDFVSVKTPEKVYWKEYVYERKEKKGKDILIHFVNMPEAKYVWRENKPPIKRKDIDVKVNIPSGYNLKNIYLLSPDNECEAVRIKYEISDGKAEFKIPFLYYYDLIIIKLKKT